MSVCLNICHTVATVGVVMLVSFYLPQGTVLTTMGAAILEHGSGHVCQLSRQGVCKLSIGALKAYSH